MSLRTVLVCDGCGQQLTEHESNELEVYKISRGHDDEVVRHYCINECSPRFERFLDAGFETKQRKPRK